LHFPLFTPIFEFYPTGDRPTLIASPISAIIATLPHPKRRMPFHDPSLHLH